MRASTRALVLFAVACPTLATWYPSADALPKDKAYDYIVIGSGAAGPIVANRLSEDPKTSVLLLEAGDMNDSDMLMQVPLYAPPVISNCGVNWGYVTEKQENCYNRQIPYLRGHVLGGTTSVNYMIHNTGPADDWEYYAKVTGDPGWSWKSMQKYFHRTERIVPPADGRDTTGEWDPSLHGKDGIAALSLPGYKTPFDARVLAAMKEKPNEFPFVLDQNSGNPLGTGWAQLRINGNKRESSATSYLNETFMNRENLFVVTDARAVKLHKTGVKGEKSVWRAVDIHNGILGEPKTFYANKDIILSAGVINTPQLLMLSGIGDADELSKLGIKPEVNLPSVGKNMSDHPLLLNPFIAHPPADEPTYNPLWSIKSPIQQKARAQYDLEGKGPLTNTVSNLIGWHRLSKDDPVLKTEGDSATGPTAPHFEIIHYNSFFAVKKIIPRPPGEYASFFTVLASVASRGKVFLTSDSPTQRAHVDPGIYNEKIDLEVMAAAVRKVQSLIDTKAFKGYIGPLADKYYHDLSSKEQLESYIRNRTIVLFHGCSTASMSPKGADWGVVDPDFRVKGTLGLRIVDASVIPRVPASHPMGPINAIAERASDIIKADGRTSKPLHHYDLHHFIFHHGDQHSFHDEL